MIVGFVGNTWRSYSSDRNGQGQKGAGSLSTPHGLLFCLLSVTLRDSSLSCTFPEFHRTVVPIWYEAIRLLWPMICKQNNMQHFLGRTLGFECKTFQSLPTGDHRRSNTGCLATSEIQENIQFPNVFIWNSSGTEYLVCTC